MPKQPRVSSSLQRLSWVFFVVAVLLAVTGAVVSWRQHRANQAASTKAQQAMEHGDAPSTAKPPEDAFATYHVPPDMPRYLFIPSISVRAMVNALGTTASNQISAPDNIYNAGWYNKSAKPGQPGAMVIDGHMSSWTAHGVFYDLKKLKPGDALSVERGDGTTLDYKVVKTQVYDDDDVDMSAVLTPVNPHTPGLNLISCSGRVKKGTNEFDKRIVVFTEQK